MASDTSLNLPYIIVTGAIIIAVIIIFIIIRPQLTAVSDTQDAIAEQTAVLQSREEFLRTIDRKVSELNSQQIHEERLSVMLPAEEQVADALRVIHRAAESSGASISSLVNASGAIQSQANANRARGGASSIPATVVPLGFTMEFGGTYQQFRAFITEIERSPRLMDIDTIQLSSSGAETEILNGQINVVFYMQTLNP